jgi:hypothetical protein
LEETEALLPDETALVEFSSEEELDPAAPQEATMAARAKTPTARNNFVFLMSDDLLSNHLHDRMTVL